MTKKRHPLLTPNNITTSRIILGLVSCLAVCVDGLYYVGFGGVVLVGITDRLDGYVARKYDLATEFGKIYDQLSDKIVTLMVLTVLVHLGVVPVWFMGLLLFRDFIVGGLRDYALVVQGWVVAANWLGKRKMDVHWLGSLALLLTFKLDWQLEATRAVVIAACLLFSYASLLVYGHTVASRGAPAAEVPVPVQASSGRPTP